MWDSSNLASTRTARRFSSRRRSAFEQAGYAVVIADHYNEGARRDVHAEPLTNRQGWEACQSAHFWKAIHATACGVPHLVDFALRTCADAAHHPPTSGVDSLPPYTHPPITHPYGLSQSMQVRQWDAHPRLRPIDGRRLLPHRYVILPG